MAAPWVLLCRFAALGPDDAGTEEPAADFSVELREPPRVSFLTVARSVHPNQGYIDPHPYLLAAGPYGALFNFATAPGTNSAGANHVLVVARHFLPAAGGQQRPATSTATAVIIPKSPKSRPPYEYTHVLGTIGMVTLHGGDDYVIVKLRLPLGGTMRRTRLFLFFSHQERWLNRDLCIPAEAQGRPFVSTDVLTHEGYDGTHLWWVDLSWGLLSCNPAADKPALFFHPLPPGRSVNSYYMGLHDQCCVCESDHKLRFVEIVQVCDTPALSMWTRVPDPPIADGTVRTSTWEHDYMVSFAEIWNYDSYKATKLPEDTPAIVLVSPRDPRLVYLFLQKRLFGVNVRTHEVELITEQPPGYREPPFLPASNVRVLSWILPPSISNGNYILLMSYLHLAAMCWNSDICLQFCLSIHCSALIVFLVDW